ncbi:phospholipid carrier-dependent glycosyltransferase [Calothrix sp. PCC 6303]|uniref:glycosyltransferase family 39 protein n=1 Tax=Calothrix sp. PCC 6303 TaxID=1170562 RepID=UPI0002A039AF|nr:glycosyltransferase family 39 protein [Calothrix sp. PCC 6303]AFZ04080.1 hypothetical protein Cal6303_5194 [Calothrix sp. PCC 6303]
MNNRSHLLLILLWLAIGTSLRFLRLESLPPWTDECATLVFSLGNSFRTVPLNQIISSDVLLQPLQLNPASGVNSVLEHLFNESTHPPVYFVLAHFWMKMFSHPGELASIWVARSLSGFFGVISIPAMFGFGYLTFRSKLIAQMAAAMMAVSPYTIFLAREARHYTLVMLLVIASLCCFVKAVEFIYRQKSLPIWLILTWVAINSLGIATHYFFTFTICSQAVVLLWQILKKRVSIKLNWQRLGMSAVGTLMGFIFWIPTLQRIPGSDLTSWVTSSNSYTIWLEPLGRLILWITSMLLLLPSAPTILPSLIIIISGIATLLFLVWSLPHLIDGLKQMQQQDADTDLAVRIFREYLFSAIALCLFFTYILRKDLTLAARFQFIYAPVVILLVAVALAGCWQRKQNQHRFRLSVNGKVAVLIIWLMAAVGNITVAWNLGYLQNQRPDILADIIHQVSPNKVLIATTHLHHGQTGRMMGLAWELRHSPNSNLQFFLARKSPESQISDQAVKILQEELTKIPRPFDFWLVGFRNQIDLDSQQCIRDQQHGSFAGEYSYKIYRCGG